MAPFSWRLDKPDTFYFSYLSKAHLKLLRPSFVSTFADRLTRLAISRQAASFSRCVMSSESMCVCGALDMFECDSNGQQLESN